MRSPLVGSMKNTSLRRTNVQVGHGLCPKFVQLASYELKSIDTTSQYCTGFAPEWEVGKFPTPTYHCKHKWQRNACCRALVLVKAKLKAIILGHFTVELLGSHVEETKDKVGVAGSHDVLLSDWVSGSPLLPKEHNVKYCALGKLIVLINVPTREGELRTSRSSSGSDVRLCTFALSPPRISQKPIVDSLSRSHT